MDMLCLLFECEVRGVFATGGVPWGDEEIAAAIGGDTAENVSCIRELVSKGVLSRNGEGSIFSRRMVRDEQIRSERSKAGKSGMASRYNKPLTNPLTNGQQNPEDEVEDEDEASKPSSLGITEGAARQQKALQIYGCYPRKVGKPDALRAIEKALKKFPDVNLEAITIAYAERWRGANLQYCPYPATWFNRESFNDHPDTWGPHERNEPTALEKYGAGARRNAGCAVATRDELRRAAEKRMAAG